MGSPRRRSAARTALAAAAACLLAAAPAMADTYDDYTQDGAIDGCDYSPGQLRDDRDNIPSDVRQYDPGYADALNNALDDNCGSGRGAESEAADARRDSSTLAADGSFKPADTLKGAGLATALADGEEDSGFPAALVALAVLLAAMLVAGIVLSRRRDALADGEPGTVRSTLSEFWWGVRDRFGG